MNCETLLHLKKHVSTPVEEDFWRTHAGEWKAESGDWRIKPDVIVSNFSQRHIYRSRQVPSHVQWAALRRERDGALKISFVERTGKHTYPPTYHFHAGIDCGLKVEYRTIVSRDRGETWEEWKTEKKLGARPPLVLSDGSLLQLVSAKDPQRRQKRLVPVFKDNMAAMGSAFPFTYEEVLGYQNVARFRSSQDGGKTWDHYAELSCQWLFVTVKELLDGTLVAVGGRPRNAAEEPESAAKPDIWDLHICESYDKGKTWTEPRLMQRSPGMLSILSLTEEVDFVKIGDSKFLFLARVHPLAPNLDPNVGGTNVVQFYGTRKGPEEWSFTDIAITDMPHSGFPQVIRARDDALIYHNHSGVFFSLDAGATWQKRLNVVTYYPSLLQLPDGEILAACHTLGGDTYYPPSRDMGIKLMRFRYERIGWLVQDNDQADFALNRLKGPELGDFHLTVDLRHDGCQGVAFHTGADDCFVVYIHSPRSPQRIRGASPDSGQQTFLAIGHTKGGRAVNLAMKNMGKQQLHTWYQLQVCVKGNRIDAAACRKGKDGVPFFIAAEREESRSGGFGLFTDLSTAAFTALRIWPEPGNMRAYWDLADSSASEAWDTLP